MVTNLQYITLVLILKHRLTRLNYMLTESLNTRDSSGYRHSGIVVIAEHRTKNNASCNNHNFREYRIIYSELHDILCNINDKYGISILLEIASILSNFIPTFYIAMFTLQNAISSHGGSVHYVQAASLLYWCALHIFLFVWMAMCCHLATTEFTKCITHVQRLLLSHTLGHGSLVELDRFSSQLQSIRFDFNICGLFTLNMSFLGASVSAMFTYILILIQLS
jgi:hypothetical protein